jgi:exodeoxyribonuclease VII large subunit
MDSSEKTPLTVTEYIREINTKLGTVRGDVIGEVTELKRHASGHAYFTIKDKNSGDVLPCTMWKSKYALSSVEIENGMELLVRGKPEFYGPFGKLSLIADSVALVGEGALLKAYEKLKKKLEDEGLFDSSRKRAIPTFPHRIGVITSVHGAVIHDFSNNLGKYGFDVRILDTRVEGPESGKELTLAVRNFRTQDIDVLVVLRGGGSLQSLAGFNNEALVREIASFPKPVITGIGHHQDVPLAALVSDASESTPSLVAELLNASWSVATYSLERSSTQIFRGYERHLTESRRNLESAFLRIEKGLTSIFEIYSHAEELIKEGVTNIRFALQRIQERIEASSANILLRFDTFIKSSVTVIEQLERLTEINNPERQLKLGYSLAFSNGRVVRSSDGLTKGSTIEVRFAKGSAEAEITKLS